MIKEVLTARYITDGEKILRLFAFRATKEDGRSRKFMNLKDAEEWLSFDN